MKEPSQMELINFLHLKVPKVEELGKEYHKKDFFYNLQHYNPTQRILWLDSMMSGMLSDYQQVEVFQSADCVKDFWKFKWPLKKHSSKVGNIVGS